MRRKYKFIYLGVCLLLVLFVSIAGCGEKQETVKETELSVNVAPVTVQDITRTDSYSGMVRGKNEVYLMPKVSARVTGIYVKPGEQVSVGQTLITLDSTDFEAGVKQAEAMVAMAEAGKRANDAQVEAARATYERNKALYEAGAVSAQQLETVKSQYETLASGSAQAGVAQAQAGLLQAHTQLEKCVITSPINGIVGSIGVSLGDTASPQSTAAIVIDNSQLEVEILVSESEINYIKAGSPVDIVVKAVRDKPFKGTVESISTVADPDEKNYQVKVALLNENGQIKSGMFAEAKVGTISKQKVLCVPSSAIIPKAERTVVYTVDKSRRAHLVDVKTGITNSNYTEILSGLQLGKQVITKGNTLVNEGTLVKVIAGGGK